MDSGLLQTVGKIAGIGGLSLGVMLLVFRDIIRKNIFPKFTDEKLGFRLLRLIIVAAWSVAILGIAAWTYGRAQAPPENMTLIHADIIAGELSLTSVGSIVNNYGEGIDPALLERIAQALELGARGKAAQAIPILESVAGKVDAPALQADLATLYALAGDIDAARTRFKTVLNESPDLRQATRNLETLERWREQQITAGAMELEPNDDLRNANEVPPGLQVTGGLSKPDDIDSYVFTAADQSRDWYVLELLNRSPMLQPHLQVFNADRSSRAATAGYGFQVTAGQDVSLRLVFEPATQSYVTVRSVGGSGAYALTIRPEAAYDAFEPNDNVLGAKDMGESTGWEAGIMDPADVDCFRVRLATDHPVQAVVANLSADLQPVVIAYDADKRQLGSSAMYGFQVTPGQNVALLVDPPSRDLYLEIRSLGGSGQYRLSFEAQ